MTNTTPTPGNAPGLPPMKTKAEAYTFAIENEGLAWALELMLSNSFEELPKGSHAIGGVSAVLAQRCAEMTLILDGGISD